MILGFLSTFRNSANDVNAKPTNFIPKIWRSILCGIQVNAEQLIKLLDELTPEQKELLDTIKPKHHSIRSDFFNKWQPGMDIEMVDDNESIFAPTLKCVSTQKIKIVYTTPSMAELSGIWIDGKRLPDEKIETLVLNDGFDTVEDFLAWFPVHYEGKIIHWTDLKY